MLKKKVNPEAMDYLEGRKEINKATFDALFGDANPYYVRAMRRRFHMIAVLKMAKANGCECYITPGDDMYTYGYMIFPDGVVMYIQTGHFWGFDFSIPYVPSRKHGTGCMCNEESICSVDWDELLKQKAEGLAFARKLGAQRYTSADEWKQNCWKFDEMIRL